MKQYFSKMTEDRWNLKNRLEAAAQKVAREMERRIITEKGITEFDNEFRDKIKSINIAYPRCKPLEVEIRNDDDRGDIDFFITTVFKSSYKYTRKKFRQKIYKVSCYLVKE